MASKNILQSPADAKLGNAMQTAKDKVLGNVVEISAPPPPSSGKPEPEESLSMNEAQADAETIFDAVYLNYPRHTSMQVAIDKIRLHGIRAKSSPMRGIRVTGPTGSGKTTCIEQYEKHLQKKGAYQDGKMPILHIRLRKKTSVTKVLKAIVKKFGDRHSGRRDDEDLNEQVRACIRRHGVELIVLDECQHLKNLSNDSMEVTDQFKVFLDDSIVPVVFCGTNDADPMFKANPELCGRLASAVELKPLNIKDTQDVALMTAFMKRLDAAMVEKKLIRQLGGLDSLYQINCLFMVSGGVIGMAYRLVREAMLIAIARDADFVEPYDLALATKAWAIPNKVCKTNPFVRADMKKLIA